MSSKWRIIILLYFIFFIYNYSTKERTIIRPDTNFKFQQPINPLITTESSESIIASSSSPYIPLKSLSTKPEIATENYYKVVKIVDGDTIDVDINGEIKRVRLIGIDTPETVDPRKKVQCFGKEASEEAKKLLEGEEVKLEADETQTDRDKYNRLLRYVWKKDGFFYNLEIIKNGYAHEYTYEFPYSYQKEFKEAENYARQNKLGLWMEGACK